MAPAGDIVLDFLLRLLDIGRKDQVFALAIDDDVRREGRLYFFGILQRPVGKGIGGDLQRLETAAAAGKHLPDGRNHFRHSQAV